MTRKALRVREPVQAYLDRPDADLLDELVERTSLSKAELIRRAIRRLAEELQLDVRPGAGVDALMGSLDSAAAVPADLAARHDDYLYGEADDRATRRR
jgi:hypothetical protein